MVRSPMLLGTDGEREGATQIAVVRMAIGGFALGATGLARVVFRLPREDDSPATRVLARLFGIRNIVLGLTTLSLRDASVETRRRNYQLNAVVDAVDVAVLAWPIVKGDGLAQFGGMAGLLGVSATLAWLELLQRLEAAA
ncbi:MAG: hypothetical protein QOE92_1171 [Chloroflexota bacterium]|nr:hypothetical protein [Chloroflexota bacterium]